MTETWLNQLHTFTTTTLETMGYRLTWRQRTEGRHCGGIATLPDPDINLITSTDVDCNSNCELFRTTITYNNSIITLLLIYRPTNNNYKTLLLIYRPPNNNYNTFLLTLLNLYLGTFTLTPSLINILPLNDLVLNLILLNTLTFQLTHMDIHSTLLYSHYLPRS